MRSLQFGLCQWDIQPFTIYNLVSKIGLSTGIMSPCRAMPQSIIQAYPSHLAQHWQGLLNVTRSEGSTRSLFVLGHDNYQKVPLSALTIFKALLMFCIKKVNLTSAASKSSSTLSAASKRSEDKSARIGTNGRLACGQSSSGRF